MTRIRTDADLYGCSDDVEVLTTQDGTHTSFSLSDEEYRITIIVLILSSDTEKRPVSLEVRGSCVALESLGYSKSSDMVWETLRELSKERE